MDDLCEESVHKWPHKLDNHDRSSFIALISTNVFLHEFLHGGQTFYQELMYLMTSVRVCLRVCACVSQTTQGVQVNCFRTLEDLVFGYQYPHKGLVSPLLYGVPRDLDIGEESSGAPPICYNN